MTKLIINDSNVSANIRLDSLIEGDWFMYDKNIYIMPSSTSVLKETIRVYDVDKGAMWLFSENTLVTPIKEVEVNV